MNKTQLIQAGIFTGVFAAGAVTMRLITAVTTNIRIKRATKAAAAATEQAQPATQS